MEENDKSEPAVSSNGGEAPVDELQALKEERDSLYDRLLRKQAEFENFKRRVERERSEFIQFASAELMKELLNALDSFDLALRNTGGDLRGFELIYKQLQDTLTRFGLKAVEAKGQTFDPNFHQAVATQPTDEVEENTVVEEMRKGYMLNGRLLRPAMVTVASKKE
jgi:molecular chaperone GrpE